MRIDYWKITKNLDVKDVKIFKSHHLKLNFKIFLTLNASGMQLPPNVNNSDFNKGGATCYIQYIKRDLRHPTGYSSTLFNTID